MARSPTVLDRYVLPLQIAGLGQTLAEYCHPVRNRLRRSGTEITHHRHRCLLRARRERPCRRRTAGQRDELAPLHSITSSARASTEDGRSRPSAFAVLRLMTSSYLEGCSTGRSAGLAPLRILSM